MNKEQFLEKCKKEQSYGDCFYAVYDNFLPYQEYGALREYMEVGMGWYLAPKINIHDVSNNDFYMTGQIFDCSMKAREQWNNQINVEIFTNISRKLYIQSLIRIKANFYISSKVPGKIRPPEFQNIIDHKFKMT